MFFRGSKYTKFTGVTKILILAIIMCIMCIGYNSTNIVANARIQEYIHQTSEIKTFVENNTHLAGITSNDETVGAISSNIDEMGKGNTILTYTGNGDDTECRPRVPQLSQVPLPSTALASFMGSGNTWTRHLIQQMSGIATSAVYCDRSLARNGFPYECYRNHTRVAVVKTHRPRAKQFDRAVLILRNPFDAFISALNWRFAGHVDHAEHEKLREGMSRKLNRFIQSYKALVNVFVKDFEGPIYILQYENLKSNLTNELTELAKFLNLKVRSRDIECTVRLQSGNFHRQTDPKVRKQILLDVYDHAKQEKIFDAMLDVETTLEERFHKQFKISKSLEDLFTGLQ